MGKPEKEIKKVSVTKVSATKVSAYIQTGAKIGPWFWFPKPGFSRSLMIDVVGSSGITCGKQNLDRSFHFDKKDIIDCTK